MRKIKKINYNTLYNSAIFSEIYRNNKWGGKKGEFYSGMGSYNYHVKGYVDIITNLIIETQSTKIVEVGCGDFNVSSAIIKNLGEKAFDFHYTGYDVVKPLIARNKFLFGDSKVNFVCKDTCTGKIKTGDLLIIRQVLQHLNNKSIQQIVNKFKNYKYIIVTEHQASERYGDLITPNKDHKTGPSIRLQNRSGVYLNKAPFHCTVDKLLYSIPQPIFGLDAFINTYVFINI